MQSSRSVPDFSEPQSERLLFSKADVQTARNGLTLGSANGLKVILPIALQEGLGAHSVIRCKLNQIPKIPVQIFENSNSAVVSGFRVSNKFYSLLDHIVVVSPKIVRTEKQKDSAARLITDKGLLFWFG